MNYKRRYLAVFGEIGASKPLPGTAFDFIRIHYLAPGQDEISEHVPEAEL